MEKQTVSNLSEGEPPVLKDDSLRSSQDHKAIRPEPDQATSWEVDFLSRLAMDTPQMNHLRRESRRCLIEIAELRSENRWADIVALFHPVEEKIPELEAAGFATRIRSEIAFALDHMARFEESISLYRICVEAEPSNFQFHAGLAYTLYNSLYAAKARQVMLHPAERKARVELAHKHFAAAQQLRPERVTNYYRQAMLYKQIQFKRDKAVPLFNTAIQNWQAYSEAEREARHQERKNYIKSLYHLASCLLEGGQSEKALELLQMCLREDESSDHVSIIHKYFALGKTYFHLGDYSQARKALSVAVTRAKPVDDDYVFELLARVHLAQDQQVEAWETVNRVPLKNRRPYFRWTEADVLAAMGKVDQACQVLKEAAERDRRGCHKALMRLVRLEFRRHRYLESLEYSRQANAFFQKHYQNPYHAALFWEAAALLRLQRLEDAKKVAAELSAVQPNYPYLGKLNQMLEETIAEH